MPRKPTEPQAEENTSPKLDPQKQYLMDQFGNLMEQVGDGFGGPLQEELISRLEQTIADFHEEVNEMLTKLKENSEKRHEKLKSIWNNPDEQSSLSEETKSSEDSGKSSQEMSEWEKRIETQSNDKDSKKSNDKVEKKKGFFGRKKK